MSLCAKRMDDEAAAALAASVASYGLGVPQAAILSAARGSVEASFARQVAMYLCHAGFELSLTRVAVAFGRDRSTVAHACHVIEDRRDDAQFDLWIGALEAMLYDPPPPGREAQKAEAQR
jgi:chromosomal replication initiation ATPase DnaA